MLEHWIRIVLISFEKSKAREHTPYEVIIITRTCYQSGIRRSSSSFSGSRLKAWCVDVGKAYVGLSNWKTPSRTLIPSVVDLSHRLPKPRQPITGDPMVVVVGPLGARMERCWIFFSLPPSSPDFASPHVNRALDRRLSQQQAIVYT